MFVNGVPQVVQVNDTIDQSDGNLGLLSFPFGAPSFSSSCPSTSAGQTYGNVQTSQVNEASGLAASRVNAGVYWVNNDSGNGAMLYGLLRTGEHVARLRVVNAQANDWEDVAVGPGAKVTKR